MLYAQVLFYEVEEVSLRHLQPLDSRGHGTDFPFGWDDYYYYFPIILAVPMLLKARAVLSIVGSVKFSKIQIFRP